MTSPRASPLDCSECEQLIPIALDDALTPAERARFETHLTRCTGCRGRLEELRRALAQPEASEPLSDETRERLLQVFRAWRSGRADR